MPAPMAEAVWTQATQQLVLGVKLVKGAEAQVLLGGDEPVKLRRNRFGDREQNFIKLGRYVRPGIRHHTSTYDTSSPKLKLLRTHLELIVI